MVSTRSHSDSDISWLFRAVEMLILRIHRYENIHLNAHLNDTAHTFRFLLHTPKPNTASIRAVASYFPLRLFTLRYHNIIISFPFSRELDIFQKGENKDDRKNDCGNNPFFLWHLHLTVFLLLPMSRQKEPTTSV